MSCDQPCGCREHITQVKFIPQSPHRRVRAEHISAKLQSFRLHLGRNTASNTMRYQSHRHNNTVILFNADFTEQAPVPLFDRNALSGNAASNVLGRGSALMFSYQGTELVLKSYRRGGAIAKIMRKTYWYTGLAQTRMWREFKLLDQLRQLNLPAPEPVAARCQRTSPATYRGDLITVKIASSSTLAEVISVRSLTNETWQRVGQVIGQFHQHQVYHADLNANNILLTSANEVYLIDFDKGSIRPSSNTWKAANISRLLRSLRKLQDRQETFHFTDDNWQSLIHGYRTPYPAD